jgi:hypothetical protein
MKALHLAALCVLIAGCATGFNPRYYYGQIEVDNLAGETIRNLKVQVGPGGRVLECAEVTKDRICEERFVRTLYPQEMIEVSWQTSDGRQLSAQMNPQVPVTLVYSQPLRVLMEIYADGSVKFYIKQSNLYLGD